MLRIIPFFTKITIIIYAIDFIFKLLKIKSHFTIPPQLIRSNYSIFSPNKTTFFNHFSLKFKVEPLITEIKVTLTEFIPQNCSVPFLN